MESEDDMPLGSANFSNALTITKEFLIVCLSPCCDLLAAKSYWLTSISILDWDKF